jgi:hypothetical protein
MLGGALTTLARSGGSSQTLQVLRRVRAVLGNRESMDVMTLRIPHVVDRL